MGKRDVKTGLAESAARKHDARTELRDETATVEPPTPRPIARSAYLVILSGPDVGRMFKIQPGSDLLIGREKGLPIRLSDVGVSRRHARVKADGDGVVLEDMRSHNGTYVGDERISSRVLAHDDMIRIGANTVLKFSVADTIEDEYQRRLMGAALKDPLTSVHNRLYFEQRLAAECASARRHGRPLCMVMIDLDRFKRINDTFGHLAGDAVLKNTAHALRAGLRAEDILARYGGEEFAVIARDTDLPGAELLAERLRADVERTSLPWKDQPADQLRVTVSIGVAQFTPSMTEQDLIEKADSGLYLAKQGGRNRVVVLA